MTPDEGGYNILLVVYSDYVRLARFTINSRIFTQNDNFSTPLP